MAMMKAAAFLEKGRIEIVEKPIPDVGPNDALIRITTTTICGTDVHILKGEYPVEKGLTVGHEPVGVIEKLGSAVQGYQEGQRVIAGAICPNFNSYAAQDGYPSQDGSYLVPRGLCGCHGYKATAGWRFGNLIDGTQAEYVLVPDAQANLAPIPDARTSCLPVLSVQKTPTSRLATPWWCLRKVLLVCVQQLVHACWAQPPSLLWTAMTTVWILRKKWAQM